MDIGIVSSFIDEFSGGIGVYTHQILKNLYKMDKQNDYHLIHSSKSDHDIYSQYNEIIIPQNRFIKGWGQQMFWRYFTLPWNLKKYNLDVVHDPYELGPFTFKQPFRKVITVHDLGPLILPELFKEGDVLLHRLLLKKTIEKADKIITVSYNSQRDLMDYLNVPEEDIEIIYNGVDDIFQPLDEKTVEGLKNRLGLPDEFILSVGGLHPIKNIPRLLQAYYMARKNGLRHKLVLVGGVIDGAQEIFPGDRRQDEKAGAAGRIDRDGKGFPFRVLGLHGLPYGHLGTPELRKDLCTGARHDDPALRIEDREPARYPGPAREEPVSPEPGRRGRRKQAFGQSPPHLHPGSRALGQVLDVRPRHGLYGLLVLEDAQAGHQEHG